MTTAIRSRIIFGTPYACICLDRRASTYELEGVMMTAYVFVHSPLVGPMTWKLVADDDPDALHQHQDQ